MKETSVCCDSTARQSAPSSSCLLHFEFAEEEEPGIEFSVLGSADSLAVEFAIL